MKKRLRAWGNTKIIPIVGCFIFNTNGKLLLLQRHTADLGGGQWGTAGGRIETGESSDTAIIREIQEETGLIDFTAHFLGTHQINMPHGSVLMDSYKAKIPDESVIILDPEEHHNFKWFDLDTLLREENILWGIPTILLDFGLIDYAGSDPTLADGSEAILLSRK
jgi:8-oxo-dGTP diphosphatase